ncbi:MAG: sterol desaturase family protein [Dokdonella sp.]
MQAFGSLLEQHPGAVRAIAVGATLLMLLAWQYWRPRRDDQQGWLRQARNVALMGVSTLIVYLLLPLTTVILALRIGDAGYGLFNRLALPLWVELAVSMVVLDLAIYWQHRWFHAIPLLWRMHRVHHTDTAFDVSLGLRFHPAEILLSLGYKFALVVALGIAPVSIVIYELLLSVFALITHANVAISASADRWLRTIFITPDWHRVHHSVHRDETDSNYGNILSIWDRLFASYVAQPRDGHISMQIGLDQFREPSTQTVPALLMQPLIGESRKPSTT